MLGIGAEFGGFCGGAGGGGGGMDGGDIGGGGQGHGDVGGSFGMGAGGFSGGDFGAGFEDGGDGAEVRQGGGVDVPAKVGAATGAEGAAGDAEVIDLVEVADVRGEPVDGAGERVGERALVGKGEIDIASFLEVAGEQRCGIGGVELCPVDGSDEAVVRELVPSIARGGEAAADGGLGVGQTAS